MDDPAEPRWLTAEERQAWLTLMAVVMRLPTALDAQLRAEADLSYFEYSVMAMLSEGPNHTRRMSVVAALTEGSLPRLSQVVARLEKRGYITRSPDPDDGRYTLASLTEAGWQKVVATAPGHVEEVRRLVFDPLNQSQVRQLAAIAGRISSAIDPHERFLREVTGVESQE
ncbi:MAG TPA: MarR family transcriptional regulator [Propionibacteriaceae bacterium]|jgi:DNA-binding MarR family transcriptional regulator|nr:MarR family transcriptional regulator [Propionibacteriaceae bacterium]HML50565.1 MarR family winged helix-turn-helix transcriptional regulator [Propionicimonas sp.]